MPYGPESNHIRNGQEYLSKLNSKFCQQKIYKPLQDYKQGFPKWDGSGIPQDENSPLCLSGMNLLKSFLIYDPIKRISAKRALVHPYFDG